MDWVEVVVCGVILGCSWIYIECRIRRERMKSRAESREEFVRVYREFSDNHGKEEKK